MSCSSLGFTLTTFRRVGPEGRGMLAQTDERRKTKNKTATPTHGEHEACDDTRLLCQHVEQKRECMLTHEGKKQNKIQTQTSCCTVAWHGGAL